MKKLLKLSFALLSMAFIATSCGNDDDGPAVNLEHLDHRWYPVSTKLGGVTVPYDGHESCGKDYTEFLTNGTVREVDYYDCQTDAATATGTYTAAEQTLTTTIEGEIITYDIDKLDAQNFEITTTFNGADITYIFTSNP